MQYPSEIGLLWSLSPFDRCGIGSTEKFSNYAKRDFNFKDVTVESMFLTIKQATYGYSLACL